MSEYSENVCKICLLNNDNCMIMESSQYINVFDKLFEITEYKHTLWLCVWCRAVMKKVKGLLSIAKYARMLPDESKTKKVHLKENNLSIHHNSYINIQPKERYIEEKDTIKTNEKENLKKEHYTLDIKRDRLKKEKIDKINFDVLYLNIDEQNKEIEDKKKSVKYLQWSFKCECCGISFQFKDDYNEHQKRHDVDLGNLICNICQLRFKSTEVLSQHMLAHKRRFRCRLCGTKFKRWSHCVAHKYKCGTNSIPAICGVCKKIFGDQHSLKVHTKNVHVNNKKYACDHCNKQFQTKQRLTVHIRSHTGLKPFSCEICLRTFTTGSNLRAHSKVHSEKKEHYCVECNKFYKTEKSLKRHFLEASRHAVGGKFPCKECSKKFATENILHKHVTAAHLTEHRCVHCFKLFSNNSNLSKHIRSVHTIMES